MMKQIRKNLLTAIICIIGVATLSIVATVFLTIFMKGRSVLSWSFILESPTGSPLGTAGGILPAILGSLGLGFFSSLIGGVMGILVAIWLVYYGKKSFCSRIVTGCLSFLSGAPSIILGLVGYTLLIVRIGMPRSLFSASLTVAVMILPFISIRTIKIFQEEETDILKQALSLGISKEHALLTLVLPNCLVGLMGTLFIGMAYGMGAAAPVMYTGAVMFSALPVKLDEPFMALPNHLYHLVSNGISYEYAYGTALVLILLLVGIQLFCQFCYNLWTVKVRKR